MDPTKKYKPRGLLMWDTQYLVVDNTVHVYHLQIKDPRSSVVRSDYEASSYGHAESNDLIHWKECPTVVGPGPEGSIDDLQPYTGCAIGHKGRYYLFYSMRKNGRVGMDTGVAIGDTPYSFERYPGNPVLEPDPSLFYSKKRPMLNGCSETRDVMVIPDPRQPGFYAFYGSKLLDRELGRAGAVGVAWSSDLLHWEHRGMAYAPDNYANVDVVDVFPLDGRWYMTTLTANVCGSRGIYSEPHYTYGTVYMVADEVTGPYAQLDENILVACEGLPCGFSCRTFLFDGVRHLMYTDGRLGDTGTLSLPKVLKTDRAGHLLPCYCDRVEILSDRELLDGKKAPRDLPDLMSIQRELTPFQHWQIRPGSWTVKGGAVLGTSDGWCVQPLDAVCRNFIFSARITPLGCAAAGLSFRHDERSWGGVVLLDMKHGQIHYMEPADFRYLHHRSVRLQQEKEYHLRIIAWEDQIEAYLDDVMLLQFMRDTTKTGRLGLFVEGGKARFTGIKADNLCVT